MVEKTRYLGQGLLLLCVLASCGRIDPASSVPVMKQLDGTSWSPENQPTYTIEIRKNKVKVRLGGVLGLAETPYTVKVQATNFVLVSLYEDTPNPFLMALSIVDSASIRAYIWAYQTDPSSVEAQNILDSKGRIFKRK